MRVEKMREGTVRERWSVENEKQSERDERTRMTDKRENGVTE